MSIDGTGVLESDLAFGVYNKALDLYDSGLDLQEIETSLGGLDEWTYDEFERDIYLTAKAKAYWEIGILPDSLLKKIESAINDEKGLEEWKEFSKQEYINRKAVLEKFIKQISAPNQSPRPRIIYETVKNKYYKEGDSLVLNLNNKEFKGLVIGISEYRGVCDYDIAVITPEGYVIGHKILSTLHTAGFVYGASVVKLDHKLIEDNEEKFKVIGNFPLDPEKIETGSYGGVIDMGDVQEEFERIIEMAEEQIKIGVGTSLSDKQEDDTDQEIEQVKKLLDLPERIRGIMELPDSGSELIESHLEGTGIEKIPITLLLLGDYNIP